MVDNWFWNTAKNLEGKGEEAKRKGEREEKGKERRGNWEVFGSTNPSDKSAAGSCWPYLSFDHFKQRRWPVLKSPPSAFITHRINPLHAHVS